MSHFPPLVSTNSSSLSSPSSSEFFISPESVFDLFYSDTSIFNDEIRKLQNLLNLNSNKIILKRCYGTNNSMDREKFRLFVYSTCQLEGEVSNEIFSCSINNFAEEGSDELPDQDMTKSEFTTAFVRLANLWALMNEGMADSSQLTRQTAQFLKHVSEI